MWKRLLVVISVTLGIILVPIVLGMVCLGVITNPIDSSVDLLGCWCCGLIASFCLYLIYQFITQIVICVRYLVDWIKNGDEINKN